VSHISIGSVKFPTNEFAIAGTAELGIRKSGKTYSAKGIAEQLMEQGIPIIVFDAIGSWKHLKTPGSGDGFPVVVAGGEDGGDIHLSPKNVSELIRAAMRSNINLVIDLYDPKLSKADWRKIVQNGFHTLLYENKKYGHRYIILEEAAEYIPQRITDGETYAAVEKVARMGGNVGLGLMIINQRSQEVNKSVLDLCENLVLMRQRGSNAIDSVEKWMERVDKDLSKKISASLPNLGAGECWVWAEGSETPELTKTARIKSFHPDRTKQSESIKLRKSVDTSSFITKMWMELPKLEEEKKNSDPEELRKRIRELESQLKSKPAISVANETIKEVRFFSDEERKVLVDAQKSVAELQIKLEEESTRIIGVLARIEKSAMAHRPFIAAQQKSTRVVDWKPVVKPHQETISGISGVQQKILNAIAEMEMLNVERPVREIVALMSGYTNLASAGYVKAVSSLRTMGMIDYPDTETVVMTQLGRAAAHYPKVPRSSEEVQDRICNIIGGKSSQILRPLIEAYPKALPREEVAAAADYTNLASAGFVKAVSRLRTLGFVSYPDTKTMKATDVLFLK
jgi:hypothetical protein